jgi:site-specific recombinase XerD
LAPEPISLREAAAAFLAERDVAATSRRVYALTLGRLQEGLRPELTVAELSASLLRGVLLEAYPDVAPATWNHNLATLKSFCAYCRRQGWILGDPAEAIERRRDG